MPRFVQTLTIRPRTPQPLWCWAYQNSQQPVAGDEGEPATSISAASLKRLGGKRPSSDTLRCIGRPQPCPPRCSHPPPTFDIITSTSSVCGSRSPRFSVHSRRLGLGRTSPSMHIVIQTCYVRTPAASLTSSAHSTHNGTRRLR